MQNYHRKKMRNWSFFQALALRQSEWGVNAGSVKIGPLPCQVVRNKIWSVVLTRPCSHIGGSEDTGDKLTFIARVSRVTWRVRYIEEGRNVSVGLFTPFALAPFFVCLFVFFWYDRNISSPWKKGSGSAALGCNVGFWQKMQLWQYYGLHRC